MRADRDLRIAYPVSTGSSALGVWPQAGFIGIAYRLATLSVPRIGAIGLVTTFFYLM